MNEEIFIEIEKLHKGWILTSIKDFADIVMGQSPPSETYNDEKIGLPFFQGKAEFTDLHPIVKKWCKASNKIAERNDILMSVRAPVGTTNIADIKCCIGRGLAAIRYDYCNKFLFYYFRLIEKKLDEKGTGTTFRAISGDVIKNTQIYLPPLAEQHRIVSKIEELFSSLDKGIDSLKTAQAQLKIYRQSVLKWAFEGKLTQPLSVDSFAVGTGRDLSLPLNGSSAVQTFAVGTGRDLSLPRTQPDVSPMNHLTENNNSCELPAGWKWEIFNNVCIKIGDIDQKCRKKLKMENIHIYLQKILLMN